MSSLSSFRIALVLFFAAASSALAAPTIKDISPRGLRIGQPTTIVISGSDLTADTRMLLPANIASQTVKGEAKADRLELEVRIDPATQPGIYAMRVAGSKGISNPVAIDVDQLPQSPFAEKLGVFPLALDGNVGGPQVLRASFTGKKDQRVVLDALAQRLGSALQPVVRLYDARGKQIAWSPPRQALGGDARCETVLPADGEYSIELHDQLYRAAGPAFFRLKIGDLQYADFALPLAVAAGSKQALKFASSNLTLAAEVDATGVSIPGQSVATLPATERYSGAAPRLAISEFAEMVETPPGNGKLQELSAAPVGISGIIGAKAEEDKYLVAVQPGQKLRFDVIARQVGSKLDGVLTIQNEQGAQVATGDDRPGSSDPMVDFAVPEGVTKLQVAIKDLAGEGGPDYVYRIAVRDLSRPEFAVTLATDRINIPAGGTQVIPVQVERTNYAGAIELGFEPQPPELQVAGNVVPPGATIGLVTISSTTPSPLAVLTRLVGRTKDAPVNASRIATFGDAPGSRYQPRFRQELGLAVTEPAPISIAWTPAESDRLTLGGKLAAPIKLTRTAGVVGNTRIRLLTTQPMPKKTIKENNQDKVVDDLDRALRLEGEPTFPPDQTDVSVNILVPGDLPQQSWDLVLVAELLSADGKNVVTSTAAPVRTLLPVSPFTVELVGEPKIEAKAGAGETGKFTGKITRAAGYTQPIAVTLEGLPKDFTAPTAIVPPEQSEFTLPVSFAYGSKPGELKGVKLVALSAPVAANSVRSNSLDVAVNVVPGEKPAAEPPKEIFEDDEKFAALLTEGGGRAIPDQRDKYSGTYSLRVAQDQKFNPNLPNLGVKIRENPGPGEYRYLRFAWKKAGGNSICLQLNHDGNWGPGGGAREGAKFRYHAGPGVECYGASVLVDDKLPRKFEVVTRDLFADFGEFTLTGLAFSPVDGNAALFDHLYLARQPADFELLKVETK